VAKNIVAAGLATRCEVQLAWAIGLSRPVSVAINTFGTSRLSANQLTQLVDRHFDLSVYGIIRQLDLLAPRYRQTACYGHFGREVFPGNALIRRRGCVTMPPVSCARRCVPLA
jgi:S-adenosylmethionine synthetase